MEEQRRLLDELMGKSRNEDGERNKGRNFWDDDVDKFYLAGFSPFWEFKNTKSFNLVPDCYRVAFPNRPKLRALEWEKWSRNDDLKAQYDALPQKERDKYGYDYDLMLLLEELVQRCDQRVRSVQEEIRAQNEQVMRSMSRTDEDALNLVTKELDELKIQVNEGESKAEREGRFEDLQALMLRLDLKTKEKAEILRRVTAWREESQRAVCDISGNVILPPGAGRQSIHDHEAGKQFQGWKTARTLLKELKARNPQPARSRGRSPPQARRGEARSRSRDRDRDRSRDRERDRRRRG